MNAARFVGVTVAPLVAFAACGNDFEALFQDQNQGNLPASTVDAGDAAQQEACPLPPASACQSTPKCDGEEECKYSCGTCGCNCPPVECKGEKDSRSCDATCARGTSCDVTCSVPGKCKLDCKGCKALFACVGSATNCDVGCKEKGQCDLACDVAGPCTMECPVGSQCFMSCSERATSCTLECPGGTLQKCTKGFACNRACPN